MALSKAVLRTPRIPLWAEIPKTIQEIRKEIDSLHQEIAMLETACGLVYDQWQEMSRNSAYLAANRPLFTTLRDRWQDLIRLEITLAVKRLGSVFSSALLCQELAKILVTFWIKSEMTIAKESCAGRNCHSIDFLINYDSRLLKALSSELTSQGIWHSISSGGGILTVIL
jgi:hypothetical protein